MIRAFITLMIGATAFGLLLVLLCEIEFRPIWRTKPQPQPRRHSPAAVDACTDVHAAADVVDEDAAFKAWERTFTAHERTSIRIVIRELKKLPGVNR